MRAGREEESWVPLLPAGLSLFHRSRWTVTLLLVVILLLPGLSPDALSAQLQPEMWRILVVRVDFTEEVTDEPSTSGRGKFDLRPISAAIGDMRLPFDGPPHDRVFYEQHLDALSHYYDVVSEGRVRIEADVFPSEDTLAYTLPGTILDYGNGRTPEEVGQLWWQLISDAAAAADADPDGPSFSDYDSYLFIHAGLGFETGQLNDIRSVFVSPSDLADYGAPIVVDDGLTTIEDAWILPEVVVANGRAGLNGILAKFFGHQLGLPGLSNFADGLPAVGGWSLMDVGANRVGFVLWNGVLEPIFGFVPPHPIAWSKARLGWIGPVEVERDTTIAILAGDAISTDHPDVTKAVKVALSPTEYLLLSNRQQRGRPEFVLPDGALAFDVETSWVDTDEVSFARQISSFEIDTLRGRGTGPLLRVADDSYDLFVPSSGVLVWHVDSTVFTETPDFFNSERTRPAVMLHEADGARDIGNAFFDRQDRTEGNRADAFFAGSGIDGEPSATRLADDTRPSSRSHTGLASGVEIEVLDEIGDVMRVAIRFAHSAAGWPASLEMSPTQLGLYDVGSSDLPQVLAGSNQLTVALDTRGAEAVRWGGRLMAATADRLLLEVKGDLMAVDPQAGAEAEAIWVANTDSPTAAIVATIKGIPDPMVAVADTDGLHLLRLEDGSRLELFPTIANAMAVADLGGDGQLHLVAATTDGLQLVDATGLQSLGSAGRSFIDVMSGDLDRDAQDDVVAIDVDGGVWIYSDSMLQQVGQLPGAPIGPSALGDIDADGQLEIVIVTSTDLHAREISDVATLLAADGFPVQPPAHHEAGAFRSGPILADLDGDGAQEILLTAGPGLYAYRGSGQPVMGFPLPTTTAPMGAPVAIASGGRVDVAVPTQRGVQRFSPGAALPALSRGGPIAWAQSGADAQQQRRHTLVLSQAPTTGPLLPADQAYCYPNPVVNDDPRAHVRFRLTADASVDLDIYDAIGVRIESLRAQLAGGVEHELSWSVADYASGLYLCRLQARGDAGGRGEVTLRLAVTQ